jgi:hypothetical protein
MALTIPPPAEQLEADVLPLARHQGFDLIQREVERGQIVWSWKRDDAPGPYFLTRREALFWMYDHLYREGGSLPHP